VGRIENIKLMAESGCRGLFIGFESIDDETVRFTGKRQNRPSKYKEVVHMLREHGISAWGSFVFGFDTDDPEVFDRTVECGIDMKLTMALYAILTPYPATQLYRRLKSEGRLTDERWWLRRDHDAGSPYYVPKQMTREQLREGWVRAWTQCYSPRSMWDRFTLRDTPHWLQIAAYWPLNLMQHALAHRKIAGGEQRFRSGVRIEDDVPLPAPPASPAQAAAPASPGSPGRAARRQLNVLG